MSLQLKQIPLQRNNHLLAPARKIPGLSPHTTFTHTHTLSALQFSRKNNSFLNVFNFRISLKKNTNYILRVLKASITSLLQLSFVIHTQNHINIDAKPCIRCGRNLDKREDHQHCGEEDKERRRREKKDSISFFLLIFYF